MELRADRGYLTTTAYADDRYLRDRLSLYEHQQPRIDLRQEVLSSLGPVEGKTVVDVGCGNGAYLGALAEAGASAIGLDLSPGMLEAVASPTAGLVVADVQSLPLSTGSADAALAMHMLYHVPDPGLAVGELRRVLRPGGKLVTAVGGSRHLAECNELWLPLLREAGLDVELADLGLLNGRLPVARLEELLRQHFAEVHLRILSSTVVLTDPGPLLRHAASTTAATTSERQGVDLVRRLGESVAEIISSRGEFRLTTEVALFQASAVAP